MNIPSRTVAILIGSIACLLPAHGAEISKLQNTTALNVGGAWVGGVVPGTGDVMLWDGNYTIPGASTTLSQIGGDISVLGLKVTNVGGAPNAALTQVGFQNTSSANTLTIGSAGFDLSTATQSLTLQSKITLGANQTWTINNANNAVNPQGFNNGEDLGFQALVAGAAFNLGGNTVTTTGNGHISITSGYTMSNGTINVGNNLFEVQGGASRLTTINSNVTFNVASGSTLQFQATSGGLTSSGIVNLNGGTLKLVNNNATPNITITGTVNVNSASTLNVGNNFANGAGGNATGLLTFNANLIGSAPLSVTNTTTAALNNGNRLLLGGNNSGYSGTITLSGSGGGGRFTRLTSVTAGSAAATWSISSGHTLQVDGLNVQLGTIAGAGNITNSHATNAATLTVGAGTFTGAITDGTAPTALTKIGNGTLTLTGFNSYTGNTTVSTGTLIATPGALNGSSVAVADGAIFDVRVTTPGSSLTVPAISIGTSTGGTLLFEAGTGGNLLGSALSATTFTPVAPTTLKLTGSGFTTGSFPLISYGGTIGGLGFGGLSLVLPPRIIGSLTNDNPNSTLNVNITGLDLPKWTGAVNGNWDIDDGTGTGTPNWKEVTNGGATRYIQTASGSDSVRFDDSAAGATTVSLTAALTPNSVTVDNSALTYTFTGSGRLTGTGALSKAGGGTLIIANTGVNDYAGGTTITAGSVQIGDGVTTGAGNLPGAVTNDGTLILNRPDNFTAANAITGGGGLTKNLANTATISGATTLAGPVAINGGTLRFTGGGSLSGVISGAGGFEVGGGTLQLSGPDANTYAGSTTVSNGILQLNKSPNTNAVTGNVLITGGGVLAIFGNEQIPDTATITFTGTSADSTGGSFGTETVTNVIVNPSVATGQFIMRSGFTVTGTATVQNGILGVASGNTATVNAIVLNPQGIVRIAGSGGPSTLNIGAGGITASGGEIQVKFNTNAQDAVLNLGGDFTATGNVAITNANFVGGNLNQINLLGTRIFNIAAGTTTTVRPTVDGTGGLTKIGNGTLDLLSTASYVGDTVVGAGTLRTSTLQTNTASLTVADNATLSVRIPQPGTTLTTPAFTLGTGATGAKLIIDLNGLGNPAAAPLTAPAFTANGSSEITILGVVTNGVFPLIDYDGAIGGAGIGGFTLKLPLRVAGVLQNNAVNTSVDVNILGVDNPHWNGNLSSDWDIDNGSGTGTANWKTAVSNTATRYLQGAGGTDHVVFDDGATGGTSVNLTTTLTPASVTFDNTTKNYTLVGSGKLSGTTALTKRGAGMLTIANTTTNDYSGGTTIETGTLRVGDGVTAGAGTLGTAAVTNDGTLILDRPDDFTLPNVIAGSGTLVKNGAGIATLAAVPTFFGATAINTGALAMSFTGSFNSAITNNSVLQLDNAVTLASPISGPGTLVAQGAGTKMISGGDANTYSGLTTVSSGTLSLNKVPGVNAVGGDILITGTGVLAITSPDQIPDSATITHTGSANSTLANETVATIVVNTTAGAQIIANTGLVVSNAVLLQNGVFSVASGHSSTVNQVIMSGGTLRVAANAAASTLTIGGGGIITTGGVIEVGNGVQPFDAVMVLGGDLTASATLNINRGGFTGAELRRIDLGAAVRNFDISAGTTTVRPDLVGAGGGISKTGDGILTILGSQSYSSLTTDGGITNLQTPLPNATITNTSGTLNVNANATNSAIVANATTNFSTSQTLASLTIGAGGVVTLTPSPGLEPGAALASEFLTEGDSAAAASTGAPLQAVPEPGAPSLLAAGLLSLLARRRRPAAK